MSKSLAELQKECFNQVNDKGFYIKWNRARNILRIHHTTIDVMKDNFEKQEYLIDLAEMALMDSEIAEAMEEIRNGDRIKAVTELAGLVIRVLSYCENQKFNLEDYIISELERNKKRELYHSRMVI